MKHDLAYYRAIQGMTGVSSAKEAELRAIRHDVSNDFANSLDCEKVQVNGEDSVLLITKTVDRTIKNIVTRPDDNIHLGDIVRWSNDDWIVDVIDSDDRVGTRGKMRRCNVVLRWMTNSGMLHAYSGVCEDATKYSEGVTSGKLLQVADFQIKVKLRLDKHTSKINRGRRFLLDAKQYVADMEDAGDHPSAYTVTRRNVLTGNHREHGYVELTLVESAFSEQDNADLMIADYYDPSDVYTLTIDNAEDSLSLAVGESYSLTYTATKNGEPLDQTSILFRSSDLSTAIVSDTGVVEGVSSGECSVVAKAGTASKEIAVRVSDVTAIPSIKIFCDNDTILYGQTKRIDFTAYVDGVETETSFSVSISEVIPIASVIESGDGYVVVRATDDVDLIGATFILTIASASLGASQTKEFKIVGWF